MDADKKNLKELLFRWALLAQETTESARRAAHNQFPWRTAKHDWIAYRGRRLARGISEMEWRTWEELEQYAAWTTQQPLFMYMCWLCWYLSQRMPLLRWWRLRRRWWSNGNRSNKYSKVLKLSSHTGGYKDLSKGSRAKKRTRNVGRVLSSRRLLLGGLVRRNAHRAP